MITSVNELTGDVKVGGSLVWRDHTFVDFVVLRDIGQARSKVRPLNFRKANFQLLKEIVNRVPCSQEHRSRFLQKSSIQFKS